VALGAAIAYVTAAAFRVASQSVTVANRLSLENAILRSGVTIAHQELDFWTQLDDPTDTAVQKMRGGGNGAGLPFTAFSKSWAGGSPGDTEGATGFDPRDTAWAVSNSRMWWRGNMAEKLGTDLRFGRYGLFANRSGTINAANWPVTDAGPNMEPGTGYGTVSIPHSWLYNQMEGIQLALGYYGFCDYLPANAIYAYYTTPGSGTNKGGMPTWTINAGGPFNNGDGGQTTPRSKYRNSYQTSYAIVHPSAIGTSDLRGLLRRNYGVGYGSSESSHAEFNRLSAYSVDYLPKRPENWPGLAVSVQRFIKNTRFVNMCRITWTNPLSGESIQLAFSGFGTTLRGARQQRRDTGGWARWDNNATPPVAANDLTLDGTRP
jgi:hypothetical protein